MNISKMNNITVIFIIFFMLFWGVVFIVVMIKPQRGWNYSNFFEKHVAPLEEILR